MLNKIKKRDRNKNFYLMLHHKAPHRNWMPNLKHLDRYKDTEIPLPPTLFDDFSTRSQALKEQEINIDGNLYQDYDFKVHYADDPSDLSDEQRAWKKSWEQDYGRMNDEQKKTWDKAYASENEAFRKAILTGKDLVRWKYQRYLKDYLLCIASVDENIGRMLDYMKQNNLAMDKISGI